MERIIAETRTANERAKIKLKNGKINEVFHDGSCEVLCDSPEDLDDLTDMLDDNDISYKLV